MNETREEPDKNNAYFDRGAPTALLNLSQGREKPRFQLNSTISEGYVGLGLSTSLSFWIVRTYYHLSPDSPCMLGLKPGLKHTFRRGEDQEFCHGKKTRGMDAHVMGQTLVLQVRHDMSHRPQGSSGASGFLQHPRANTLFCNSIPEIPNDGEDCYFLQKLDSCLFFWNRNLTLWNCPSSGFASTSVSPPGLTGLPLLHVQLRLFPMSHSSLVLQFLFDLRKHFCSWPCTSPELLHCGTRGRSVLLTFCFTHSSPEAQRAYF